MLYGNTAVSSCGSCGFLCATVVGGPPADGTLSGSQVSRHWHSPGWNQKGPTGFGPAWSSGEVLPQSAAGSGADQSHVHRPLLSGHGEEITPGGCSRCFFEGFAFGSSSQWPAGTRGRPGSWSCTSDSGPLRPETPAGRRRYDELPGSPSSPGLPSYTFISRCF